MQQANCVFGHQAIVIEKKQWNQFYVEQLAGFWDWNIVVIFPTFLRTVAFDCARSQTWRENSLGTVMSICFLSDCQLVCRQMVFLILMGDVWSSLLCWLGAHLEGNLIKCWWISIKSHTWLLIQETWKQETHFCFRELPCASYFVWTLEGHQSPTQHLDLEARIYISVWTAAAALGLWFLLQNKQSALLHTLLCVLGDGKWRVAVVYQAAVKAITHYTKQ